MNQSLDAAEGGKQVHKSDAVTSDCFIKGKHSTVSEPGKNSWNHTETSRQTMKSVADNPKHMQWHKNPRRQIPQYNSDKWNLASIGPQTATKENNVPCNSLAKMSIDQRKLRKPNNKIKQQLCDAITKGDIGLVSNLVKKEPELVNVSFCNSQTALMFSLVQERFAIAKMLLELGSEPGIPCPSSALGRHYWRPVHSVLYNSSMGKEDESVYPLQFAADIKNISMMELLLEHGADPQREYRGGALNLAYLAVKLNAVSLAKQLIQQAREDNMYSLSHVDLSKHLMAAVEQRNLIMAKMLVDNGANPDREYNGVVPLVAAANIKDMGMCLMLINAGCSLHSCGSQSLGTTQTPLSVAISAGMDTAITTLLTLGSNVNFRLDWSIDSPKCNREFYLRPGSPMLHFAVYKRNPFVARRLIEYGADVNGVDFENNTALHLACQDPSGYTDMARYLLSVKLEDILASQKELQITHKLSWKKVDIDRPNKAGMTPLMIAAKNNNPVLVDLLLDHGANPNMTNHSREEGYKYTPLHYAAMADGEAVTLSLLRSGASVNSQSCQGVTPTHLAIKNASDLLVNILLDHGADLHILTHIRDSSLHLAVCTKSPDMVSLLLDAGVRVNVASCTGETPLMLASRHDCTKTCRMLIQHGALLNLSDRNKETALSLSVYFGFQINAKLLIEEGANLNLADKRGTTPIYWSIYNTRESTLKRLILAGASFSRHQFLKYPRNLSIMRNTHLVQWVLRTLGEVRSLQALSRQAARAWVAQQALGRGISPLVARLPIPPRLQQYLLLQSPEFEEVKDEGQVEEEEDV